MLKGIMPVLVTPMHDDGSPDLDGHVRLLEHVMTQPVGGLWSKVRRRPDFCPTERLHLRFLLRQAAWLSEGAAWPLNPVGSCCAGWFAATAR